MTVLLETLREPLKGDRLALQRAYKGPVQPLTSNYEESSPLPFVHPQIMQST